MEDLGALQQFESANVATVLTVHGIETHHNEYIYLMANLCVATVLTVHGIETVIKTQFFWAIFTQLQQSLPFTVLKLKKSRKTVRPLFWLQQSLPFTVLKLELWLKEKWPHYEALQQSLPFTVLKLPIEA